jgi:hypothetical protein
MKNFSHSDVQRATRQHTTTGLLLAGSNGMTIIPRDSDIVGAAAVLAIVLVTGLLHAFGL